MATTLALAMRASMSANGVVSGANQAAASLASFGKAAAQASADASKLSAIDFSSFGADASSAASSVKALASRAAELKEAFDNGSISAEQMQAEMQGLASAAARLSQMQREGLSVTQEHASASEVFAETQRRLSALLDAGAISEETYARAVARANDRLNESSGAAAEARAAEAALNATMQEGASVAKSVMTAEERHASTMHDLSKLLKAGAISQETFNRAVNKADDELKRASSQTDSATNELRKLGDQAKKTSSDISLIKNIAIGAVVAKGISMIAHAFTDAGRAALSYATNVANAVDHMNDLAQRTGIGVEALQTFQMAAKLSGVDDITTAVQKLAVSIGNAAESADTNAFTKLGLDFEQLRAMSPEEQFKAVQAAIAALPTEAERAAAAVAIFGRSGVELLPLMNQNLAEIEERMKRLGAVVGADQVEAIGSMNDALDMTKAMFDGIIGNVVGNLSPIVESLAEEVMSMVESFNGVNGSGGEGIANAITDALLDIAEYFAGVFDNAVAGFQGFGVTLQEVGSIFQFVGNVFTAVAETLRMAFNGFQIAGNLLAIGLGGFLEGIGSWVSSDLEQFGKDMAAKAKNDAVRNYTEAEQAGSNALTAASAAVFGSEPQAPSNGIAGKAVRNARERMTPEEIAKRQAEREQQQADKKAAREAAAAEEKRKKQEEKAAKEAQDAAEKAGKDAAAAAEKAAREAESRRKKREDEIGRKEDQIANASAFKEENAKALGEKSNEALKANDLRSNEGMSQFIALATGREDPAIAEYRKQNEKLQQIVAELRALQQQPVDMLGAAA